MKITRKTVAKELKDSGRIDEIVVELQNVADNVSGVYEQTYCCKHYSIKATDIAKEAKFLKYAILANRVEEVVPEEIENLFIWYWNRNNMYLHNYANDLTHRKKPTLSLEYLRVSQIIANLLINLYNNMFVLPEDEFEFVVPKGWAVNGNDEEC